MPTRTSSRNSWPVGLEWMPILRSGLDCSRPGMPESSTNCTTLRSAGGLPSSSLQMNTIVSAWGPLVMKVLEPLSTNSSPSWRAVDIIEPNASEPELGSVIAHAPTLSIVSRSSAQRSFWAMVPLPMIAAPVSPIETPMAVTMPGQTRHISMIGIIVKAMLLASRGPSAFSATALPRRDGLLALDALLEALALHGVHAEGREQLAQQVVGRHVAELELLAVGPDLTVDEVADRLANHLLLFGPLVHGALPARRQPAPGELDRSVKLPDDPRADRTARGRRAIRTSRDPGSKERPRPTTRARRG